MGALFLCIIARSLLEMARGAECEMPSSLDGGDGREGEEGGAQQC